MEYQIIINMKDKIQINNQQINFNLMSGERVKWKIIVIVKKIITYTHSYPLFIKKILLLKLGTV